MRSRTLQQRCCLYFSNWSKKGYSIFAGLGREVHISHLALHMYEKVLLKSIRNGVIVNTDSTSDWNVVLLQSAYIMQIVGMTNRGVVYPVVCDCLKK